MDLSTVMNAELLSADSYILTMCCSELVARRQTLVDLLYILREDRNSVISGNSYAEVMKENAQLLKNIAEKSKLIKVYEQEVEKLKIALQGAHQQNWQLAETNSQMLAELNSEKDRVSPQMAPPVVLFTFAILCLLVVVAGSIPTTLEGPFEPVTRRLDSSLRQGSDDVPLSDSRLAKKVKSPFPEQIAIAASFSPSSLWISWITGDAQIGSNVVPLDPSTSRSEVWYGLESGKYMYQRNGTAEVYNQLYPYEGLFNYTSGIIHHVRLDGLVPGKKYYYKCGDSLLKALSEEHTFQTLPAPGPNSYPSRVAVVGDLGLTHNSTTTIDHLTRNDPAMILFVGDLVYADQYDTTGGNGTSCFSCTFPNAPIRETYQPRWDGWGRFMEPLTSKVPMMIIEGNHEIEPQIDGMKFQSYQSRFAVPAEESRSNSKFYYSFNVGGIHFIMLGAYVDYNITGLQYSWLKEDLKGVQREVTPWIVAAWHPPWYNSYSSHYQEFECMRLEMESLLYQYGVDIVFSGHVHAYERMNRVYNYSLDPCGPVYITVGDGGNIEKVDVEFADDPGKCPKQDDNKPEFGGVCHMNFSTGPAKGKFCWDRQPDWSAFRDNSFGHGIIEVINSTYALWTWHRNQDAYGESMTGDQIYIVRQPDMCLVQLSKSPPVPSLHNSSSPSSAQVSGSDQSLAQRIKSSWFLQCLLGFFASILFAKGIK